MSTQTVSGMCQQCGEPFERKHNGPRERAMFCSVTCSARAKSAARKKPRCPKCGMGKSLSGKQCSACVKKEFQNRTLGDLRAQYKKVSDFHSVIREGARRAFTGNRVCAACGYDLYVQICHKKSVASFPETATLSEVNDPGNLVALDLRCHWEYDKGIIKL